MQRKTLNVIEDPQTGDLCLELTDELMEEMGWSVGDTLEWEQSSHGDWIIKKVDNVLDEEKEDCS